MKDWGWRKQGDGVTGLQISMISVLRTPQSRLFLLAALNQHTWIYNQAVDMQINSSMNWLTQVEAKPSKHSGWPQGSKSFTRLPHTSTRSHSLGLIPTTQTRTTHARTPTYTNTQARAHLFSYNGESEDEMPPCTANNDKTKGVSSNRWTVT